MDSIFWVIAAGVAAAAWYATRHRPHEVSQEIVAAVLAGRTDAYALADRLKHPYDRGEALWLAHQRLDFEERPKDALEALWCAARAYPERYLELLLGAVDTPDDRAQALTLARGLLSREPQRDSLRVAIAEQMIEGGRVDEALDLLDRGGRLAPELRVARARALAHADRRRDALDVLEDLLEELSASFDPAAAAWRETAASLADNLRAEVLGADAKVLLAGKRGALDPNAGENYRLLGAALMARSAPIASILRVQTVAEDITRATRLSRARHPSGPAFDALCLLREGRTDAARTLALRAFESHRQHFPLALVLGAAMIHATHRVWRAVELLDDVPLPDGLAAVVPDLPALTQFERRVVAASAAPLRAVLPRLAERGVTIRILPLDVRPTDLPELARFEHVVAEDARAIRAIGGVATETVAASRIEDLLDTVSPGGWVFAHELAHLALFHLPDVWRERVAALRERAADAPWTVTEYARSNDDEFFAVAYVGWLERVYERPHAPVRDDTGVVDALDALFADLSRSPIV